MKGKKQPEAMPEVDRLKRHIEEYEQALKQKSDQYEHEKQMCQKLREDLRRLGSATRDQILTVRTNLESLSRESTVTKEKLVLSGLANGLRDALVDLANIQQKYGI